jgi:hypothetical protein
MTPDIFQILKVDIFDPAQRQMWARELNVTEAALCKAVLYVGPRLNDVRSALGLAKIFIFPTARRESDALHRTG